MAIPAYLKSDTANPSKTRLGQFSGRIIREIAWGLSLLRLRDILNLSLWVIFLTGIGTIYHYGTMRPAVASASQKTADSQIQAPAPGAVVTVASLPGGPTGQLLPPGSYAAPYSYANTYAKGQCTWYVAGRRQVPNSWGNARTWYGRAQAAGWSVGTTPAIGAIAWTNAGWYGHVALVIGVDNGQVLISEMNYLGPYEISQRWAPISDFKYIY